MDKTECQKMFVADKFLKAKNCKQPNNEINGVFQVGVIHAVKYHWIHWIRTLKMAQHRE